MNQKTTYPMLNRCAALTAAVCGVLAQGQTTFAGTWTPLVRTAPNAVSLMLLLSDGTVMCANNNGSTIGSAWYRLTPDSLGSYVNGTWTTLASAQSTRLYYSSQVLQDGRVFVAGGEYGTGGGKAEVYNPLTNTWTAVNPPTSLLDPTQASPLNGSLQSFYDANSEILANGNVLISPVLYKTAGQPLIYNPNSNTWSAGPNYVRGVYQDEATWVKLPDDSILTIDPFGTNSERYIPASNTWVNDGVVPVSLYDPFGSELGAAFLLANGKAFFLGSTGNTALYTPTGTTSPGTWAAGPVIPGSHGQPDAPGAMMVTGNILCAVSPIPTSGNHFPPPVTFYEYDPIANGFISELAPGNVASLNAPVYTCAMLVLPDGNVLFSRIGSQLYVYTPTGSALAAGKPTISSISINGDGSYHLTGTKLNGISEGACYGDDLQMASNYPLVRLTDASSNVRYARTYNWSRTSVMTGAAAVTTEFKLPTGLGAGPFSLAVVANGYASDPVSVADCNTNGTLDAYDALDCNTNTTPDVCELAGHNCNTNGTLDACEGGCNTNGTPDACELAGHDCNTNGTLDACELNGSTDANANGTLDVCEVTPCATCPGDVNGDGKVDGADVAAFVSCYLSGPAVSPACRCADVFPVGSPNGLLDSGDVTQFVSNLLTRAGPACP